MRPRHWTDSMVVGCENCGRRLHIYTYGGMRDHNSSKGVQCPGSGMVMQEFKNREARRTAYISRGFYA